MTENEIIAANTIRALAAEVKSLTSKLERAERRLAMVLDHLPYKIVKMLEFDEKLADAADNVRLQHAGIPRPTSGDATTSESATGVREQVLCSWCRQPAGSADCQRSHP